MFRLAGLLAVVVGVYVVVIAVQVVSSSRRTTRKAAAIVVLGAAQYDGTPSPALQGRLDRALELYREDLAPEIVLTGSKQPATGSPRRTRGTATWPEQGVPEAR